MLDAFTDVLLKRASDRKAEDALTQEMLKLPIADIQKIASAGSVKAAFAEPARTEKTGSDDDWLKKYEGTSLYDQAIMLEEQLLAIEGERIQRRMDRPQDDDLWTKEDMIRLKKRQLDLELSKNRGADGGVEDAVDLEEYLSSEEDSPDASASEKEEDVGAPKEPEKAASTQPLPKVASYMPSRAAADLAGRAMAHAAQKVAACAVQKEKDSGFLGPAVDAISGGIKGFRAVAPGEKLRGALVGGGGSMAGGAAGSALGAGIGSVLGPLGTLGGGLVGGAVGSGKGYDLAQRILGKKP